MDENMNNNTNETENTYTSAFDNPVPSGSTPATTDKEPKVETEVIPPQTQTTADGSVYYSNTTNTSSENFNNYYSNSTSTSSTIGTTDDYSTGFATASLVMGILGMVCCCCCLGLIFDILGIVFFCIQKKDDEGKKPTTATIGLVLSIIALVAYVGMVIFSIVSGSSQAYLDMLQNM